MQEIILSRLRLESSRKSKQVQRDGQTWREWIAENFPHVASQPFAERHVGLWEWADALTPGVRPRARVEVWPRGGAKSSTGELATAWVGTKLTRRFVLIVSETQEQADKHVQAISALFERIGAERAVGKYGSSKGWRRNQLRTDNGFNVAALGLDVAARGIKLDEFRPDLICHEYGTIISTGGLLMPVQDHPTAQLKSSTGFAVTVAGLPFSETVTPEHRWWVKSILNEKRRPSRKYIQYKTEAGWREAHTLTTTDYIGLPIPQDVIDPESISVYKPGTISIRNAKGQVVSAGGKFVQVVPEMFSDPEWWWFFGLWWGDGHISVRQVGITVSNKQEFITDRIFALLKRSGLSGFRNERSGCHQIVFTHTAIARWLKTWSVGNSRKQPPVWVEHIDHEYQRELIKGYLLADGYISTKQNEVRLTSVHLPGLLCVRRILARLGIAPTIRKGIAGRRTSICGVECNSSTKYDLRFQTGAEKLGIPITDQTRYKLQKVFIEDGVLWSRVNSLIPVDEAVFVPITTETHDYTTAFGRSHNCFDDVDSQSDSGKTIDKKIRSITTAILPAGSSDCAVLFLQNLIRDDGVVGQLVNGEADFLRDREPAVVEPAVFGLQTEIVQSADGANVYRITGGEPSWAGQSLAVCEHQINEWGLKAFLREAQHDVANADGYVFNVAQMRGVAPADVPELVGLCLAFDMAATEDGGDHTAGVLLGRSKDRRYYVLAVIRGQWSSDRVQHCIKATAAHFKAIYSHLKLKLPQDPGQAGKSQAAQMKGSLQDFAPGITPETGKKVTRAAGLAEAVNIGNVFLVEQDLPGYLTLSVSGKPLCTELDWQTWHRRLKRELKDIREDTLDQIDDQMDASSAAFNELATPSGWASSREALDELSSIYGYTK